MFLLSRIRIKRGRSVHGRCIDNREIKLIFISTQFDEQIQNFINDFFRTSTGTIDFVNDNDWCQMLFQSFLQNKTRLRHGTFKSINDKQNAINHLHDTFYFTAKIGVTGRIQNVDLFPLILDSSIFGKDRDTAFLFNIVRIHCTIANFRV